MKGTAMNPGSQPADLEDPRLKKFERLESEAPGGTQVLESIKNSTFWKLVWVMIVWLLVLTVSSLFPVVLNETLDYALQDTRHEYMRIIVHWFVFWMIMLLLGLAILKLWRLDRKEEEGNSSLVRGQFGQGTHKHVSLQEEVEGIGPGRVQKSLVEWQRARTMEREYAKQMSLNKKYDPQPKGSKTSVSGRLQSNTRLPSLSPYESSVSETDSTRRRRKRAFRY